MSAPAGREASDVANRYYLAGEPVLINHLILSGISGQSEVLQSLRKSILRTRSHRPHDNARHKVLLAIIDARLHVTSVNPLTTRRVKKAFEDVLAGIDFESVAVHIARALSTSDVGALHQIFALMDAAFERFHSYSENWLRDLSVMSTIAQIIAQADELLGTQEELVAAA